MVIVVDIECHPKGQLMINGLATIHGERRAERKVLRKVKPKKMVT